VYGPIVKTASSLVSYWRSKHGKAEGLSNIIVGSRFEAKDDVGIAVVAREHDDRRLETVSAQVYPPGTLQALESHKAGLPPQPAETVKPSPIANEEPGQSAGAGHPPQCNAQPSSRIRRDAPQSSPGHAKAAEAKPLLGPLKAGHSAGRRLKPLAAAWSSKT
jgi:hypothetical protein